MRDLMQITKQNGRLEELELLKYWSKEQPIAVWLAVKKYIQERLKQELRK